MGVSYATGVRRLGFSLLVCLGLSLTTPPLLPQTSNATNEAPAAHDQFFTGLVVAISDESLTVDRKASGKNSATKTFIVTPETQFEGGKPRVRAQVTVRYITTDDGDRAVHVILRRNPK